MMKQKMKKMKKILKKIWKGVVTGFQAILLLALLIIGGTGYLVYKIVKLFI